jgi:hypothetical protein
VQGEALSTLLFKFALEYAIRKVQENQEVGENYIMRNFINCTILQAMIKSRRMGWKGNVA